MKHERVPPGQRLTDDFPVLDLGIRPAVTHESWRLDLFGLVTVEVELDWPQLMALPQVVDTSDFHCVTHWSRFAVTWEGIRARDVIAPAKPLADARYVTLYSSDGYTTNLPLVALLDDDALIAHGVDGGPLSDEHGGPVRLVVPKRYGWKSAKWLSGIEFHSQDRPGYWEVRGYHNEADPWLEQRYFND